MSEFAEPVVVHHAASPSEAEVVRLVLAGAGINAMIPDQNTPIPGVDLTPFDGETGVAGCEVVVAKADADQARQILAEAQESSLEEGEETGS